MPMMDEEEKEAMPRMVRGVTAQEDEAFTTWSVAIIGGLLVGGFLYFRLHHLVEKEVVGS